MLERVHRLALIGYRRLPKLVRRWGVRLVAPKYTVGAISAVERADGRLLLVRQAYRQGWGIPGGLLARREAAADAARREVLEEVGLHIELVGEPVVVVAPEPQRIDIVYRARPVDAAAARHVRPCTPEIVEAGWFDPASLPELQEETAEALIALARAARRATGPLAWAPLHDAEADGSQAHG